MIPVQFSDKITPPMWSRDCKCSDCTLNPVTSHGIYLIGAYKVPSMLSRRGNHVTEQAVEYRWTFGGSAQGGQSGAPFPNARNNDERAWCI